MPRGKKRGRAAAGDGSLRKKVVIRNGKEYVYWEARYTAGYDPKTGKQMQRSISGKTQAEVAQKLRVVTMEIGCGTFRNACSLTVGQWLDAWSADYLTGLKPRTLESYHCQIENHIRPELGEVKLETLNAHTIQHFYNALSKKGLSPKSVKIVHGVLHKALQQAVAIGYLRVNPSDACTLPRIERKELKPLDDDGIRCFMDAIKGHPFESLFLVTLFTGMREGEILGLTWDCVDFKNGTLLINKQLQRAKGPDGKRTYQLTSPKNSKWRKISPAGSVMELLRRQKSHQAQWQLRAGPAWEDNGLVFTNELGGHLSPYTVYHNFKRVAAAIGRPEARVHDQRHSYAVAAIKSGDDIKTVQGNLGHATASFTLDVYGHVTDQMKKESAQRMEKFIQSISG